MSLPNTNITLGAPPLLWSDVSDALKKVNENFDSVAAALGVAGITPINFETLDTSLKPTSNGLYSLGDTTHKWTGVFTESYNTANPLNGLWAGPAQIKGIGYTVNLPANSTIGGDPLTGIGTSLIIDPDKTFFKSVQVDNGNQVVANNFADTLNLNSGTAIQLVVDSGAESITINNAGVTSLTAGVGISVSAASGNITVTNNGVRSLTSTTALPVGRVAGAGINIDASSGDGIKITNTGVLTITSGVGITVATDTATGEVQIINSAPAGSAFSYVEINGDSDNRIAADLVTDVLSINSGLGITLTKNISTDSFTIAVNPTFDLTGNVTGNLTGDVLGDVTGNLTGNVLGDVTGNLTGNVTGNVSGNAGTVTNGVYTTGDQTIGGTKTFSNTITGSITGNAGTVTNGVYTNGSYSDPTWLTISKSKVGLSAVENTALSTWAGSSNITTVGTLGSLAVTNGISAASFTGNIFTSLIDSSDSSAITITPLAIFSADIIAENDIRLGTSESSIRGNTGIKLVPNNSLETSANIRLAITSDNTIEPRLIVDTPDGVDLMLGTGLAGMSVSKINGRVNLSAGNNAFIVRSNGSWWMTPLTAAPVSPTIGLYIASGTTWDPAAKANGRPYPVWYDGTAYNALY